jgi:uncharacterized damage-inducible protein DinB
VSNPLTDLVRHNSWATDVLLDFLEKQPETVLQLHILPGGYGTIVDTLHHMISSEASYLRRLSGAWDRIPWDLDAPVSIPIFKERNALLVSVWDQFLARDYSAETAAEAHGDGQTFHVTLGIIFTQAIHHGSEHRAQINDILGFHGIEPPEAGSWEYGLASGLSWEK